MDPFEDWAAGAALRVYVKIREGECCHCKDPNGNNRNG
jgi:hypothetical protein